MTARYLIFAALVVALSGCDYSQKKPQARLPLQGMAVRAPAATPWSDEDAVQERSLRLMGPGVSRAKQTML